MITPEILNLASIYFFIGLLWCLFIEFVLNIKMSDGARLRYLIFWPYTMGAFIIGIIDAWNDKDE